MKRWFPIVTLVGLGGGAWGSEVLEVTRDDTRVDRSCQVRIADGTVVADANGDGVVHIVADNITVEMVEASVLRGAAPERPWDALTGVGVRVEGQTNVTLIGWKASGFKVGLWARRASGLEVVGGDFSDNYRQRLRSTPEAEDSADWLYPHRNDAVKWRNEYGAALCVEESSDVTIREILVRRGQNGIILDRVNHSRVYDNDCSFLSGWGLALWRSSSNVVSGNAFDFCVRGHVEGVYNRGQDSAGILCFEQSSHNLLMENSATHGGDGFFGFAGREAIGEVWMEAERERLRQVTGEESNDDPIRVDPALARQMSGRGCNYNVLFGNDFSYASAHGIEITFSEHNRIENNRLVENAICGVWGGYSSWTRITRNRIEGNGGMAYGLERGGVNMEHASYNLIRGNVFRNNKCGVHFWWDNDEDLLKLPGVLGHEPTLRGNQILLNQFIVNRFHPFQPLSANDRLIVLHLRDESGSHLGETVYAGNEVRLEIPEAQEFDMPSGLQLSEHTPDPYEAPATPKALGRTSPVGARAQLRGRRNIVMDLWGPWDHESPLVRPRRAGSGEVRFDLLGFEVEPSVKVLEGVVRKEMIQGEMGGMNPWQLVLKVQPGVTTYQVLIRAADYQRTLSGTLISTEWLVTVFPWTVDPREDLNGWRAEAEGEEAMTATVGALDFPYGWGGPREQGMSEQITGRGPKSDRFGMIARTTVNLPAGRWVFRTLSDDGVRVRINGQDLIENWTWHGPTRDEGVYVQKRPGTVEMEVEHFEIDGFATLSLEIEDDVPR